MYKRQETPQATSSHVLKEEKQFSATPTGSATSTLAWGIEKWLLFQTTPTASALIKMGKEATQVLHEFLETAHAQATTVMTSQSITEYATKGFVFTVIMVGALMVIPAMLILLKIKR